MMMLIRIFLQRLKGRMLHIGLAGLAKYGVTACLIVYLRAHGMRTVWGVMVGLAIGTVVLVMSFWPSATPPPPTPPTPPGA